MKCVVTLANSSYRYINTELISANGAYVGLARPGEVGSWQTECKVIFVNHSVLDVFKFKLHFFNCSFLVLFCFLYLQTMNMAKEEHSYM